MLKLSGLAVLCLSGSVVCAVSQTTGNPYTGGSVSGDSSATIMWGVSSFGSSGSISAGMHVSNGIAASQVNAARRRALLPDNITIQSIGSQSIISVTVNGSNNAVEVDATQSSSNSGSVSNTGTVNAY